ncbi:anhydro-N-acetylmuramic acid kinase [Sinimarinibacterium thermocellulolyticum]|uniref:Anhydro-N-acetylmuramic acid kinase n=1 Tax=Sinimarinibacterium thermocellulolyticum TaxID=3170016 RepID=A0ABV2A6V9_9GAMM
MPRCIGLMSGTSMDGIDAVLCDIDAASGSITIASHARVEYVAPLRARLLALQTEPERPLSLRELADLDHAIAEHFAHAALTLMNRARIDQDAVAVIGSHGQTLFHDPLASRNSLQLGDPALIAARCGIAVVADFRRGDLALGGQGAPLVSAFHRACFVAHAPCAILNLGGIANVTLLTVDGQVCGFDTGPANALMDLWVAQHRGLPFDRDGEWARSGTIHPGLLQACLADAYFAKPPPKSTGRDYFNLSWLRDRYPRLDELPAADVQRTLCELTAAGVAAALSRHAPTIGRLLLCGGGRRNALLRETLQSRLPQTRLELTDELGIDGDLVEAAAFAWLAWRRVARLPGNVPSVTGAAREAVLGGLYLP